MFREQKKRPRTKVVHENPAPLKMPEPISYRQHYLVQAINSFHHRLELMLFNEKGCCHGLCLLWLQKMSECKEGWFYDIKKTIIHHDLNKIDGWKGNLEIQKFIDHVNFAQNTCDLWLGTSVKKSHRDNAVFVLELDAIKHSKYKYDIYNLHGLLSKQFTNADAVILWGGENLSSPGRSQHAVAIFKRQEMYYFYNPNHDNGEALCLSKVDQVVECVCYGLYTYFGVQVPSVMKLELFVFAFPQPVPADDVIVDHGTDSPRP